MMSDRRQERSAGAGAIQAPVLSRMWLTIARRDHCISCSVSPWGRFPMPSRSGKDVVLCDGSTCIVDHLVKAACHFGNVSNT